MPKFRFEGDRRYPGHEQHARDGEPQLPRPTKSTLENTSSFFPISSFETPIMAGERWKPRLETIPRSARNHYRGEHAQDDADAEEDREAPDRAAREGEQDYSGDSVVMLPSRIARKPFS